MNTHPPKSNPLILLSGLLGELTLIELISLNILPTIGTYAKNSTRKKLIGNIFNYSDKFKIIELQQPTFNSLLASTDLSIYSHIITIDWDKTFFHTYLEKQIPIYHIHPSLLPKYRGYTAISEQIKNGVIISGVTAYLENGHIDAGDIIFQREVTIDYQDIPATFMEKISKFTALFIKEVMENKNFKPYPQDEKKASMTGRIRHKEMIIDFNLSAISLHNFIRAYSYPYSLAFFYYNNNLLYVPAAYVEKWSGDYGRPGEIVNIDDNGVEIALGDGSIIFTDIVDESFNKFDYTILVKGEVII